MAATRQDIREWFQRGATQGSNFMIVVCDTFDYEDYPVFVSTKDFANKYAHCDGKNMQKIMEVYDLSMDMEEQLAAERAFNFPAGFQE